MMVLEDNEGDKYDGDPSRSAQQAKAKAADASEEHTRFAVFVSMWFAPGIALMGIPTGPVSESHRRSNER